VEGANDNPGEGPCRDLSPGEAAMPSPGQQNGGGWASDQEMGSGDPLAPDRWDRRRDGRALVGLVLIAWLVYLATATYDSYQINDNRAVNLSAWSLGVLGTLELPEHWKGGNRWIVEGRDGALHTNRFPGAILWAAPFHAAAERLAGSGVADHAVFLNHAPGGVAAASVTALAVGASFLVFRRLANRRLAVTTTVFMAFGTAVWSVSADSMWTHGLTHLTLMLGVLGVAKQRYARGGAAFAVAVLTRPHVAVVPAVMGVWESITQRRWRPMLVVGVTSLCGVAMLAAYSQWLFETWLPIAGYNVPDSIGDDRLLVLTLVERTAFTLAHPVRGVLIYAPALVVLLPFLRHGWRTSPDWARSAALAGSLYLLVQVGYSWAGGADFFGSRMTLETLVLLSPLLLRTWQSVIVKSEPLKGAAVGLLVVGVFVHTYGALNPISQDSREEWESELDQLCEREPELSGCATKLG